MSAEQMRDRFEAYMVRQNVCTRLARHRSDDTYRTVTVQRAWELWQAALANPASAKPAIEHFNEVMADTKETPLERLRFFCSIAMNGQDWIDVEPFFDALATQPQAPQGGVTRWIAIEEMPATDDDVLTFGKDGHRIALWHLGERLWFTPTGYALRGVTHWMPLPAAPTETPEAGK